MHETHTPISLKPSSKLNNFVMPKSKIHIVEDQQLTSITLRKILEDLEYEVHGLSTHYHEALEYFKHHRPDLVLIDIYLQGEKTGIELAHTLNNEWHIPFIFITSHADKATIEAAKHTKPLGFIVKPFESKEIYATVEMALKWAEDSTEKSIFVPDGAGKSRIPLNELLYAQAEGNYTYIITPHKRYVLRKGLKDVAQLLLPHKQFVRIHKSFLINKEAVLSKNGQKIHLQNGTEIPIGRAYAHQL
jgi:DNA-binding LytR/AlgR family response regulator